MNEALVFITDDQIGDNVCAMGAVQYLAQRFDRLWLSTRRPDIEILMRPSNVLPISDMTPSGRIEAYNFFIGHSIHKMGRAIHPIQSYLSLAHQFPQTVPKPYITKDISGFYNVYDTTMFDVLIAPWAKDPDRSMNVETLCVLVNTLERLGGYNVGILGAMDDPNLGPGYAQLYGMTFGTVAMLMRRSKFVITVDSGMSRLAHAALDDGSKHIVLAPSSLPVEWTTYEGCEIVMATLHTWQVADIIECMESMCVQPN